MKRLKSAHRLGSDGRSFLAGNFLLEKYAVSRRIDCLE
jgi:hypothetical protein